MAAHTEVAAMARAFAANASVEVTHKTARSDELRAALPRGTEVYVAHIPGAALAARLKACEAIVDAGMKPMPHVAAREAKSLAALDNEIAALLDAGATGVMLIGGGGHQKGPFADALSVLDSEVLQGRGVNRLALAGYPEGHPQIDAHTLQGALMSKLKSAAAFAQTLTINTQFVFDAAPVVAWLEAIRAAGINTQVRIGLAGPASPATLMSYGLRCGVGPSLKALQNRPSLATHLRRRWQPDALTDAVVTASLTRPNLGIDGLHIYPFGGLGPAGAWLQRRARLPSKLDGKDTRQAAGTDAT